MTYQRWGATKFLRNRLRLAIDSKYNAAAEHNLQQMPLGVEREQVDMEIFIDLTRLAFKKDMSQPDVDAILKRASVIVNTTDYVCCRLAAQAQVIRCRMPDSMLTEDGGAK